MKCPECAELGEVKQMFLGWDQKSEFQPVPFTDDFGNRHVHFLAFQRLNYACSRGHEWNDIKALRCPCGWPFETGGTFGSSS